MYAASSAPRESTMDCRMASSSTPSVSMSSGVRCAVGLSVFFCMTVMDSSPSSGRVSVVDVADAGGRVDAGLDRDAAAAGLLAGDGGELSRAQVAHGALAHRQHA